MTLLTASKALIALGCLPVWNESFSDHGWSSAVYHMPPANKSEQLKRQAASQKEGAEESLKAAKKEEDCAKAVRDFEDIVDSPKPGDGLTGPSGCITISKNGYIKTCEKDGK